jgi:hypothetical protein
MDTMALAEPKDQSPRLESQSLLSLGLSLAPPQAMRRWNVGCARPEILVRVVSGASGEQQQHDRNNNHLGRVTLKSTTAYRRT